MKLALSTFRGELPLVAPRLLPDGMASAAVNSNVISGDLASFGDIGSPFSWPRTLSSMRFG